MVSSYFFIFYSDNVLHIHQIKQRDSNSSSGNVQSSNTGFQDVEAAAQLSKSYTEDDAVGLLFLMI
jgi:hypothetical protein